MNTKILTRSKKLYYCDSPKLKRSRAIILWWVMLNSPSMVSAWRILTYFYQSMINMPRVTMASALFWPKISARDLTSCPSLILSLNNWWTVKWGTWTMMKMPSLYTAIKASLKPSSMKPSYSFMSKIMRKAFQRTLRTVTPMARKLMLKPRVKSWWWRPALKSWSVKALKFMIKPRTWCGRWNTGILSFWPQPRAII